MQETACFSILSQKDK